MSTEAFGGSWFVQNFRTFLIKRCKDRIEVVCVRCVRCSCRKVVDPFLVMVGRQIVLMEYIILVKTVMHTLTYIRIQ